MPQSSNPVYVQASDRVFQLSGFALEHQLGTVKATGAAADPILILEYGTERKLLRIIGIKGEQLDATAQALLDRALLENPTADAYALAYDARIPYGDKKFDAIVAEVADRTDRIAKRFAQRYRHKKSLFRKFELVGARMFLGETRERRF